MDLIHVEEVACPNREAEIPAWRAGDAFVSGGTWVFSEPQPDTRRLIDLSRIAWPTITMGDDAVIIAANCSYTALERFDWSAFPAARLFPLAIRSLSSSFKTYGLATIGGNICLAFAKGMMGPVCVTLDATYELMTAGSAPRLVEAADFQTGVCRTIRAPGEYLRSVRIPRAALNRPCALRRASFTSTSHVIAMAIAAFDPATAITMLTLSGALAYPVRVSIAAGQHPSSVVAEVCARHPMLDDAHGSPEYRRHLLTLLATEALAEIGT